MRAAAGLLRHGPPADDEDGYAGERVAAGYDEGPEVFGPGAADATAGVLAELAGGGRALVRYVWPAELDLTAQLAGLQLRERWDGWTRAVFTSDSLQHVSIWEKPSS